MSQSVKRINLQSQQKTQSKKLADKNISKKYLKTQIQNPSVSINNCTKKKKIDSLNTSKNFNFLTSKFTSNNTKENVQNLNLKLNRVQSQYIRPISTNSLPKTPITTSKKSSKKISIYPNKLTKQKTKQFLISEDYCNQQHQQIFSKQKLNNFTQKNQLKIKNQRQVSKKLIKTSKISSISHVKEQPSYEIKKLDCQKVKQIKNMSRNVKNESKSELKKTNKKKFNPIKLSDNIKTPINKKNTSSSSCSIKKYYVLQKQNTSQKNSQKKQLIHSTSRGTTKNTLINQSVGSRKLSTTTLMKNYNSLADLNDDINIKSQIENRLLQRVQKTLQSYQISLESEISKRKSLQVENSRLKEELFKVMKEENH